MRNIFLALLGGLTMLASVAMMMYDSWLSIHDRHEETWYAFLYGMAELGSVEQLTALCLWMLPLALGSLLLSASSFPRRKMS